MGLGILLEQNNEGGRCLRIFVLKHTPSQVPYSFLCDVYAAIICDGVREVHQK